MIPRCHCLIGSVPLKVCRDSLYNLEHQTWVWFSSRSLLLREELFLGCKHFLGTLSQPFSSETVGSVPGYVPCSLFVKTFVALHVEHLKYGMNPSRSQLGKERQGQRRASLSGHHSSAGCLKALRQKSKEELPWSSSEIVLYASYSRPLPPVSFSYTPPPQQA